MGLFSKLINAIFHKELDDEFYEELEYALISADMGATASEELIARIKKQAKKEHVKKADDLKKLMREVMAEMLEVGEDDEQEPCLITFVGVNGVGKTTSIGKLAYNLKKDKKSVLLVAADTFRAAATEQLTMWAERSKTRIVKYAQGADPGAVVFDGISSALAKGEDYVLVDTAGRLHNKTNLMEELRKINKIIDREWVSKGNTHLNYLVIDATTGQNALSQVEAFNEICKIDGVVLTKYDGTAKGGIVFAIAQEFGIPVKYVGVGEKIEDLKKFNAEEFVEEII